MDLPMFGFNETQIYVKTDLQSSEIVCKMRNMHTLIKCPVVTAAQIAYKQFQTAEFTT